MNTRLFTVACLIVGGLLVRFGVPVAAVAAGMSLAAIWTLKRDAILGRIRQR